MGLEGRKFRVIVAKPCMYGMFRPERLAMMLRDADFEVTYLDLEKGFRLRIADLDNAGIDVIDTALQQTRETIAEATLQENADAVCFSMHPAYLHLYPEILDLIEKKGMKDVLIFGVTLISPNDAKQLSKEHGVGRIFGPGTDVRDVVAYLREELPRRRPARP